MGSAVEGVSRRDRVGRSSGPHRTPFGVWFERERRLRRVPVEYVALATRIPPARLRALERGSESLPADGSGRALARALARSIGADPDEAAARVGRPSGREDAAPVEAASRELVAALALGILGLALVLGLSRIAKGPVAPDEVRVVHRPDHVGALLSEERSEPKRLTGDSN